MARLTITLTDETHRELKVRAATTGETIGSLLEGAVAAEKELARVRILALLETAWTRAEAVEPKVSDDALIDEANALVHDIREEMMRERPRSDR